MSQQVGSRLGTTDCNVVHKLVSLLQLDPFEFGEEAEHVCAYAVVSPNLIAMLLARCQLFLIHFELFCAFCLPNNQE